MLFDKTPLPVEQAAILPGPLRCLVPPVAGRFSTRATECFAWILGICYAYASLEGRKESVTNSRGTRWSIRFFRHTPLSPREAPQGCFAKGLGVRAI